MTTTTREAPAIVKCSTCGMRADADPAFHDERYGHWPTVRCAHCGEQSHYGNRLCQMCGDVADDTVMPWDSL